MRLVFRCLLLYVPSRYEQAAHIGFPHPLAHPFPVAVVLCHVLRLLVGGRSLSPGGAERVRPAADGRTRSSILFSLFSAKKRGAA